MVDCAVAEHPPAPDAVTVYVVVDEGVTVIDFVVAPPGLHNQPLAVPPFSVSVTDVPWHTDVADALMAAVCAGCTVIVTIFEYDVDALHVTFKR